MASINSRFNAINTSFNCAPPILLERNVRLKVNSNGKGPAPTEGPKQEPATAVKMDAAVARESAKNPEDPPPNLLPAVVDISQNKKTPKNSGGY
jgi:hypothetical protein